MKEIIFFPYPTIKKNLAKIISVKTRFNKKFYENLFFKNSNFFTRCFKSNEKKIYFLNFSYLFYKKIEFVL